MDRTTVVVDLAKSVFRLAVADASWKVVETHRLTRAQFERWLHNRDVALVVMESCGSAHHLARWLNGLGIEVRLLLASRVRAWSRQTRPTPPVRRCCPKPLAHPTCARGGFLHECGTAGCTGTRTAP